MTEKLLVLRPRSRGFTRDEKAIAATEFALVLPLMIALLLGSIEIGDAISASRKVTLTARTVADLVAQQNACLSASQMSTILTASSAVMAPYSSTNLSMTVTEISTDNNSNATITWSTSSTLVPGTPVTLPTSIQQPNVSYIFGTAQYSYKPVIGYVLTGPITFSDQIYLSPRSVAKLYYPVTGISPSANPPCSS